MYDHSVLCIFCFFYTILCWNLRAPIHQKLLFIDIQKHSCYVIFWLISTRILLFSEQNYIAYIECLDLIFRIRRGENKISTLTNQRYLIQIFVVMVFSSELIKKNRYPNATNLHKFYVFRKIYTSFSTREYHSDPRLSYLDIFKHIESSIFSKSIYYNLEKVYLTGAHLGWRRIHLLPFKKDKCL